MRISEVYPSIQGEGPNTGRQTLFVRFAGCNLRCPGWPCDSQHAIDPKLYRQEWKTISPSDLIKLIVEDLHTRYPSAHGKLVCLTGGEPFLQSSNEMMELLQNLRGGWGIRLECFTNGSIEWPARAWDYIDTFVLDWKLPGSGEAVNNDIVRKNIKHLTPRDAVKFTIADRGDFEVAIDRHQKYLDPLYDVGPQVYVGPVWGKVTEAQLAEWILQSGIDNFKLNVQLHNHVWPAQERSR